MDCCNNILDLGCHDACSIIQVDIPVPAKYMVKAIYFNGTSFIYDSENTTSVLQIDLSKFSENACYKVIILDENGNSIDLVYNGITYNCLQIKTNYSVKINANTCNTDVSSNTPSGCIANAYLEFTCENGIVQFTPNTDVESENCIDLRGGLNLALSSVTVIFNNVELFTTALDIPTNNGTFQYYGVFQFPVADWGYTGNITLNYSLTYNNSSTENFVITESYDANTLCQPPQLYDCYSVDLDVVRVDNILSFTNPIQNILLNGNTYPVNNITLVDDLLAYLLSFTEIIGVSNNLGPKPLVYTSIGVSTLSGNITQLDLDFGVNGIYSFNQISNGDLAPCATQYTQSFICLGISGVTDYTNCPSWIQLFTGIVLNGVYYPFSNPVNNDTDFAIEMINLNIGYQNHVYQYTTDGHIGIVFNSKVSINNTTDGLYVSGFNYPDINGVYLFEYSVINLTPDNCISEIPCP